MCHASTARTHYGQAMDVETYQWTRLWFYLPLAVIACAGAFGAMRRRSWWVLVGCLGFLAFGTEPMGYVDFTVRRWLPPLLLCMGILRARRD